MIMNTNEYLENMRIRLASQYDIYNSYDLQGVKTELYAHFYSRNERYVASKSATLYAYESNEHTFFKSVSTLDVLSIYNFTEHLKSTIDDFVEPHAEHMSTRLNAVFITHDPITDDVISHVKKFKYQKSYMFGLNGWVDVCLIVVSLSTGDVFTSRKAKKQANYFRPIPLQ